MSRSGYPADSTTPFARGLPTNSRGEDWHVGTLDYSCGSREVDTSTACDLGLWPNIEAVTCAIYSLLSFRDRSALSLTCKTLCAYRSRPVFYDDVCFASAPTFRATAALYPFTTVILNHDNPEPADVVAGLTAVADSLTSFTAQLSVLLCVGVADALRCCTRLTSLVVNSDSLSSDDDCYEFVRRFGAPELVTDMGSMQCVYTTDLVLEIFERFTGLIHVALLDIDGLVPDSAALADNVLTDGRFAAAFPHATHYKAWYNEQLNDLIVEFVKAHPQLEHVDVSSVFLSGAELRAIADAVPNAKYFSFQTDDDAAAAYAVANVSCTTFDHVYNIENQTLRALTQRPHFMRFLDLGSMQNVDAAMGALLGQSVEAVHFYIYDQPVAAYVAAIRNRRCNYARIHCGDERTDAVFKGAPGALDGVYSLELNLTQLTPEAWDAIAPLTAVHLKELDICDVNVGIDQAVRAAAAVPSLTKLVLTEVRATGSTVATLVRAAPHLTHIEIGLDNGWSEICAAVAETVNKDANNIKLIIEGGDESLEQGLEVLKAADLPLELVGATVSLGLVPIVIRGCDCARSLSIQYSLAGDVHVGDLKELSLTKLESVDFRGTNVSSLEVGMIEVAHPSLTVTVADDMRPYEFVALGEAVELSGWGLDDDTTSIVFEYCGARTIGVLACTCRYFAALARDLFIWARVHVEFTHAVTLESAEAMCRMFPTITSVALPDTGRGVVDTYDLVMHSLFRFPRLRRIHTSNTAAVMADNSFNHLVSLEHVDGGQWGYYETDENCNVAVLPNLKHARVAGGWDMELKAIASRYPNLTSLFFTPEDGDGQELSEILHTWPNLTRLAIGESVMRFDTSALEPIASQLTFFGASLGALDCATGVVAAHIRSMTSLTALELDKLDDQLAVAVAQVPLLTSLCVREEVSGALAAAEPILGRLVELRIDEVAIESVMLLVQCVSGEASVIRRLTLGSETYSGVTEEISQLHAPRLTHFSLRGYFTADPFLRGIAAHSTALRYLRLNQVVIDDAEVLSCLTASVSRLDTLSMERFFIPPNIIEVVAAAPCLSTLLLRSSEKLDFPSVARAIASLCPPPSPPPCSKRFELVDVHNESGLFSDVDAVAGLQILVNAGVTVLGLDVTTLKASEANVTAMCRLAKALRVRRFACSNADVPDSTFHEFRGYDKLAFLSGGQRQFNWNMAYTIGDCLQITSTPYLVDPYVEYKSRFVSRTSEYGF